MELFRIHKTIPFMKYSKILNAISFISFFIAIGLLVVRGLAFSIEFTGGLVMEVNYPDAVPVQELRVDLEKATGGEVQVVNFGTARDAQIRLPLKGNKTSAQMSEEVMKVIHEKAPEAQLRRTEFVGPRHAGQRSDRHRRVHADARIGRLPGHRPRLRCCCGHRHRRRLAARIPVPPRALTRSLTRGAQGRAPRRRTQRGGGRRGLSVAGILIWGE